MSLPLETARSVTTVRQASVIAYRWALTFSRLYEWWKPAGWLALPMTWSVNMVVIGLHAGDIQQLGAAAMQAPNPVARPKRRLWCAVLLSGFVLVLVALLMTLVAQLVIGLMPLLASAHLAVVVVTVVVLGPAGATAFDVVMVGVWQSGGNLRQSEPDLRRRVDGPVVIGAMFGAWPRRTGAGRLLLAAVLAEQRAAGVTMLVSARDEQTANWYVGEHLGERVDPEHHCLHIAWINP